MTPDKLDQLITSSWGLLDRFDAHPSPKQALDRFGSEVFEFAAAVSDAWGGNDAEREDAAKEGVDVIVTVFNVLRALDISRETIEAMMAHTMTVNDAKNETTHYRTDKQGVERKPVQEPQS